MTELKRTNERVNNPMLEADLNEMKTEDLVRMMAVTVNSTAQTVNQMAMESQRQSMTLAKHERNISHLLKRDEEIKLNERIEGWQDNIIKDKVTRMIKNALGKDYKNASKRAIAFGWTYKKLASYGYASSCSTKLRQYEPILEALDSGVMDVSKKEVNERYKKIQEEKERK
ncbi:hypothetical protein [Anaerococcus marasmi]|uniref:hypothetical protein n=1 Tax=Anaerococcus marasmi TaxID=2057797 RepID=UPI000CF928FF|nr:hypothetical protein [Anaerococcus marasmi]